MVSVKNVILLATAATAAVIPRDSAKVISDLQSINSDTVALTKAANNYNGGLIAALPIENAESSLDNEIKSSTSDAKAAGPASEADAATIIDYINNTLEPNVAASIKAFENKKSQIAGSGLTGTVKSDLQTLKTDTDAFAAALIANAPSDRVADAKAAAQKIDNDFSAGIAFFS